MSRFSALSILSALSALAMPVSRFIALSMPTIHISGSSAPSVLSALFASAILVSGSSALSASSVFAMPVSGSSALSAPSVFAMSVSGSSVPSALSTSAMLMSRFSAPSAPSVTAVSVSGSFVSSTSSVLSIPFAPAIPISESSALSAPFTPFVLFLHTLTLERRRLIELNGRKIRTTLEELAFVYTRQLSSDQLSSSIFFFSSNPILFPTNCIGKKRSFNKAFDINGWSLAKEVHYSQVTRISM